MSTNFKNLLTRYFLYDIIKMNISNIQCAEFVKGTKMEGRSEKFVGSN